MVYLLVNTTVWHPLGLLLLLSIIGKVHPCTGTEALYRPYGPQGE